jgi:hypothetical protein
LFFLNGAAEMPGRMTREYNKIATGTDLQAKREKTRQRETMRNKKDEGGRERERERERE